MPRGVTTDPALKERICSLAIRAIHQGWSVRKFARMARVKQYTLSMWLNSDDWFSQYRGAMQAKALDLPSTGEDIVRRLINPTVRPLLNDAGQVLLDVKGRPVFQSDALDPKAAGVALRHIEFKMMREIKHHMYNPAVKVETTVEVRDMTSGELQKRFDELLARGVAEGQIIEGEAMEVSENKLLANKEQ